LAAIDSAIGIVLTGSVPLPTKTASSGNEVFPVPPYDTGNVPLILEKSGYARWTDIIPFSCDTLVINVLFDGVSV